MAQSHHHVCLGFTDERFPAGTHICQIYSNDDERTESLLQYVAAGLEDGERTACFSERVDEKDIAEFLEGKGISLADAKARGALVTAGTRDVYFEGNRFDPERMLGLLQQYHEESVAGGYPAARVIGEMAPQVSEVPGGNRLLEYESRVSMLLARHPVTAVCQYDARVFDGATIMDVLEVHPLMVVRGAVVRNPFFIPPEEFLAKRTGVS